MPLVELDDSPLPNLRKQFHPKFRKKDQRLLQQIHAHSSRLEDKRACAEHFRKLSDQASMDSFVSTKAASDLEDIYQYSKRLYEKNRVKVAHLHVKYYEHLNSCWDRNSPPTWGERSICF